MTRREYDSKFCDGNTKCCGNGVFDNIRILLHIQHLEDTIAGRYDYIENIEYENKRMAEFLVYLGITNDEISNDLIEGNLRAWERLYNKLNALTTRENLDRKYQQINKGV